MNSASLLTDVKEWIQIDNEIKDLKNQMKIRNDRKKYLSGRLIETMKNNNLDRIDTTGSGTLIHKTESTKKGINKKYLFDALTKYFKNDEQLAAELCEFIMNNREVTVKDDLKRKHSD